jgi:hypothetical protein
MHRLVARRVLTFFPTMIRCIPADTGPPDKYQTGHRPGRQKTRPVPTLVPLPTTGIEPANTPSQRPAHSGFYNAHAGQNLASLGLNSQPAVGSRHPLTGTPPRASSQIWNRVGFFRPGPMIFSKLRPGPNKNSLDFGPKWPDFSTIILEVNQNDFYRNCHKFPVYQLYRFFH